MSSLNQFQAQELKMSEMRETKGGTKHLYIDGVYCGPLLPEVTVYGIDQKKRRRREYWKGIFNAFFDGLNWGFEASNYTY